MVSPSACEDEEALEAADLPQTGGSQTESPTEASETGTAPPAASLDQPPLSPLMDLEADFPPGEKKFFCFLIQPYLCLFIYLFVRFTLYFLELPRKKKLDGK